MIDEAVISHGKYKIVLEDTHEVNVYRHDKLWVERPIMQKMLIGVIYDIQYRDEKIKKLEEKLKVQSEVIDFYADPVSWDEDDEDDYSPCGHKRKISGDDETFIVNDNDVYIGGKRARECQAKIKELEGEI